MNDKRKTKEPKLTGVEHYCDHPHCGSWEGVKEYLGEKFPYTTVSCLDCSVILWTSEIDKRFKSWRQDLFLRRPDLFEVTLRLTPRELDKVDFARHFFDTKSSTDTIKAILDRAFEPAFGPIDKSSDPEDEPG